MRSSIGDEVWQVVGGFDPTDEIAWRNAYTAAKHGDWAKLAAVLAEHPLVGLTALQAEGSGYSLLHQACWHGRLEMVHELMRRGSDPRAQNHKGETPADVARRKGHGECAHAATLISPTLSWTSEELRGSVLRDAELLALVVGRYRWLGTTATRFCREMAILPDGRFMLMSYVNGFGDFSASMVWGQVVGVGLLEDESPYELGQSRAAAASSTDYRASVVRACLSVREVGHVDDEPLERMPRRGVGPLQAVCWFYPNHIVSVGGFYLGEPTGANPAGSVPSVQLPPNFYANAPPEHNAPSVYMRYPTAWNRF